MRVPTAEVWVELGAVARAFDAVCRKVGYEKWYVTVRQCCQWNQPTYP